MLWMRRSSEPIRRLCLGVLLVITFAVTRCRRMCLPGTHPRGGTMRPFQRSMFIRAPSGTPLRFTPICPDHSYVLASARIPAWHFAAVLDQFSASRASAAG